MARDAKELTAIELAMNAEREAERFYSDAADRAVDPRGRDMFRQLARFEAGHYRYLVRARESLGEGGDYPLYEGTDFERTSFGPAVPVDAAAARDLVGALSIAIEAEKRAGTEYSRLAEAAGTEAGRAFFRRLAAEEALHEKVLNDQFYSLSNDGIWRWGD